MKILIIGDFHGKCNIALKKIIKEEDIDLILSPGDYCGDERVAKLFFKHWYGKDEDEVPKEIMRKINKYEKEGVRAGFKVLKKLRDLKFPFLGVRGNWDPVEYGYDIGCEVREKDEKNSKKMMKMQKDYFRFIDFSLVDCEDFIIIGGASTSHPGKIDKKTLLKIDDKKEVRERVKKYNKRKKVYEQLFFKAKKMKKPIIFLTHNCPYEGKLDKVKKGPQKGRHFGSFLEKQIIRRFKPEVVICGHMHENQGKDKIKNSRIINAGAVLEKKYSVIDFDEISGKVRKVKFFK